MVFNVEATICSVYRGSIRILGWPSFGIRMAFQAGCIVAEIFLSHQYGAEQQCCCRQDDHRESGLCQKPKIYFCCSHVMSPTKKRFTDTIKPDLLLQNGQTGPIPFKYNRTINRDRWFKDDIDQGSLGLLIR